MRFLVLPLIALAVGCGPTRTAGTQGIPAEKLAVLHVTQKYEVPVVELAAIGFDDGEKYRIDGDRDFYLTPGVHHVAVDLAAKIEIPYTWFSFGAAKLEGPTGLATGDLKPGKTYELRGLAGTVQGLVTGDDMGVTREMATK